MMRPMKLAGSQLLFGKGCLEHIKTLQTKKAVIVIGGSSMEKNGILARVEGYLHAAGAETRVFRGVEPDPSLETVLKGADMMKEYGPDLIVALGGGSPMDAAKMMWVFYEHPALTKMEDVMPPNSFPPLRGKARFVCIPSTSGTASEVSRSVVITENGMKKGLGHMEMMPDIAICDPEVTVSMPPHITAETGMDALTHALEALASTRANYVSDILAVQAALDIMHTLPTANHDGNNLQARETMLNASMVAGMAFTNVSLGIVHSMAHTVGSYFHVAHGLADAILLPYVMQFNSRDARAAGIYRALAEALGKPNLCKVVDELNTQLNVPHTLGTKIADRAAFEAKLDVMAQCALEDGCTKTNPVLPTTAEIKALFLAAYGA